MTCAGRPRLRTAHVGAPVMQGGLPRQSICWQHRPKPCTENQVRKGNRCCKALHSDPGEPVNGFSGARLGPCYRGQAISVAPPQPVSRTETGGAPPPHPDGMQPAHLAIVPAGHNVLPVRGVGQGHHAVEVTLLLEHVGLALPLPHQQLAQACRAHRTARDPRFPSGPGHGDPERTQSQPPTSPPEAGATG